MGQTAVEKYCPKKCQTSGLNGNAIAKNGCVYFCKYVCLCGVHFLSCNLEPLLRQNSNRLAWKCCLIQTAGLSSKCVFGYSLYICSGLRLPVLVICVCTYATLDLETQTQVKLPVTFKKPAGLDILYIKSSEQYSTTKLFQHQTNGSD